MTMMSNNNNPQSSLPPGFRFHPTDEELILHYLRKKVSSIPIPVSIIAEVDIYKFDPWELPAQATFGEKEWYFFTPRDRKYPNGARPNRAAGSGYWKATGTDKVIMNSSLVRRQGSENIGVKKALVFYTGRPPKGNKTNWIMHEYRLAESPCTSTTIARPVKLNKGSPMRLDDWVLCRIYKKWNVPPCSAVVASPVIDQDQVEEEERILFRDIKPPPNYPIQMNTNTNPIMSQKSSSFSNLLDALDYSLLSSLLSEPTNNQNMSCFGPPPCSNINQSIFSTHDFSVSDTTLYENNSNNGLKRQRSSGFDSEIMSKKFNGSSCNFVNSGGVGAQFDISGQHSMFSTHNSLLNQQQQLLLGANVQFLG